MNIEISKISFHFVWVLDPDLMSLINGLSRKGYVVSKLNPMPEGYQIGFLEKPDTIAIRENVRIKYNFGRKTLIIESSSKEETLMGLSDVEEILINSGVNLEKGVLINELQVYGRITKFDLKTAMTEKLRFSENYEVRRLPLDFLTGDPNSTKFLHFRLIPVWSTWTENQVTCEFRILCRDEKDKVVGLLKDIDVSAITDFIIRAF